jgi:hypothetical protein
MGSFHHLGTAGDERLGSHPLAAPGLTWYWVREVKNLSFVAEACTNKSPHHPRRHFGLTFQDSTFDDRFCAKYLAQNGSPTGLQQIESPPCRHEPT